MSETNKALARRVIEELFTKHNVALIDEFSRTVNTTQRQGTQGRGIAEEWEEYDALGMMQQLGALPSTARAEVTVAAHALLMVNNTLPPDGAAFFLYQLADRGQCIMRERPRKYLVEDRWAAEGS
jgi:hypothetical protein